MNKLLNTAKEFFDKKVEEENGLLKKRLAHFFGEEFLDCFIIKNNEAIIKDTEYKLVPHISGHYFRLELISGFEIIPDIQIGCFSDLYAAYSSAEKWRNRTKMR